MPRGKYDRSKLAIKPFTKKEFYDDDRMKPRETREEQERQGRLFRFAGLYGNFDTNDLRSITNYLIKVDDNALKHKIKDMYRTWEKPTVTEKQKEMVKVGEWLIDSWLNARKDGKPTDDIIKDMMFAIAKEVNKAEEFGLLGAEDAFETILHTLCKYNQSHGKEPERKNQEFVDAKINIDEIDLDEILDFLD